MAVRGRSLTVMVHADTKVGKSTFANTAPAPRLLLDVEAAHRFLPGRKVYWEPQRDAPPAADGSWDTCVVVVREYQDMISAMNWLKSGQHRFESVVVDSLSELQVRARDQISAGDEMNMQKWGQLLGHMETLIRAMRDLTEHATNPITALVLTAMTENRDGKQRPYVQGQLRIKAPYFLDVVGYMYVHETPNPDPTQESIKTRCLTTRPHPAIEAGERTGGLIPAIVTDADINVSRLLDMVFGPEPAAEPVETPA